MSTVDDLSGQRQALLEKYNTLVSPSNVYQLPGRDPTVGSKFPVQLGGYNAKEDQKWALRSQLVDNQGKVDGVGMAVAGEDYFKYVGDKDEELKMNEYFSWLMQQADLSKPETAQWWYSKFPWMRQMRLDYARKQHDLSWKLAEMNVNGPQSTEDFLVLYMIQQGLLKPPTEPTYKLGDTEVNNNYISGLFSPTSKVFIPKPGRAVSWSNPLAVNGTETVYGAPGTSYTIPNSIRGLIGPISR